MSKDCDQCTVDRRSLLGMAGLGMAAAMATPGVRPAIAASASATALTSEQALAALKDGNKRYVSNPQLCTLDLAKHRGSVAEHQAPWAIIVGCADSRVPPELLFGGLGVGELFVARNAGNLIDTAVVGTVEYGAAVLGAPLIVVLGHQRCGAVAAACDVVAKNATFPGSIGPMIDPILPAAIAMRGQPGDFVDNTIRESARRSAARLTTASPMLADLVKAGKLKIVAARYDLDRGSVEFLTSNDLRLAGSSGNATQAASVSGRADRAPDADRPVLAGRNQALTVRGEADGAYRPGVPAQGAGCAAAAADVPHLDVAVLAGRGQQAAVRREGQRGDAPLVRIERALHARGRGGPQVHPPSAPRSRWCVRPA